MLNRPFPSPSCFRLECIITAAERQTKNNLLGGNTVFSRTTVLSPDLICLCDYSRKVLVYPFYKVLGVGCGRTLGRGSWQMDLDSGTSELDKCLCLGRCLQTFMLLLVLHTCDS